jgi:hypothetical protein
MTNEVPGYVSPEATPAPPPLGTYQHIMGADPVKEDPGKGRSQIQVS